MAGTARTDLAAITILSGDITGAPKGIHLEGLKHVIKRKLDDAAILAARLKAQSTESATRTACDVLIASLV